MKFYFKVLDVLGGGNGICEGLEVGITLVGLGF